jgi:small-conductance mechanosensitive channel
LHSLLRRTPTEFDNRFIQAIEPELRALVLVFALDTGFERLRFVGEGLRRVGGDLFFLAYLALGLYIAWLLIGFTSDWYRGRIVASIGQDQYENVVPLFKRFAYFLLISIALIILLDHFGFNTAGVLVIIGLIAIIFYFGSRDTLSDAFSGFVILLDQPFRVGDRIRLSGMDAWGDVIEIGTRATRILTPDNRVLVVANTDIGNSRVFNYTYPDPTLRFELDIGVQYDTDIAGIRQIIKEAVAGAETVLPEKPIEALFIEFGDRGLVYRVRWWVDTYTNPSVSYDKVNEAMYAALGEAGIKVSFTTYNVVEITPGDSAYLQPQITGESLDRGGKAQTNPEQHTGG